MDVLVGVQRQVLVIQRVRKTVEVPQDHHMDRNVVDTTVFRHSELLRYTLVTKRPLILECMTETHTSQSLVRIAAPSPMFLHVPFTLPFFAAVIVAISSAWQCVQGVQDLRKSFVGASRCPSFRLLDFSRVRKLIGQGLFYGCEAHQDVGMVFSNDRDALQACLRIDNPCMGSYFVVCGRACSCREDIDMPGNRRHIVDTVGHMIDMFPKGHFRVVDMFLIVPDGMTKCWSRVPSLAP